LIHLVRHGETEGNTRRFLQFPETSLSPRGLAQADALATRLAGSGIAAVLTSDYARAETTAARVAEASGAPLHVEPLLRERNFGELRGTAYAELAVDPFAPDYAPPGGETWPAFHARVDRAWQRVRTTAERVGGPLVVVTHGLVCLSLATRHLTLPGGAEIGTTGFSNTSLTSLEPRPPFLVSRINCTAHLDHRACTGAPV
jgi:broad specificity phosphatase PhoE